MAWDGRIVSRFTRWLSRLALAGVIVLMFAAMGPAPAGADCLPACAPTVSSPTASQLTAQSAVLAATVNTAGSSTQYTFQYSAVNGNEVTTKTGTVPGSFAATTISWPVDGLIPGSMYSSSVRVGNSVGSATASGSFSTPLEPSLPITLHARRTLVIYDSAQMDPRFTVRVANGHTQLEGNLQTAAEPATKYTSVEQIVVNWNSTLSYTPSVYDQPFTFDRNTRFRIELTGIGGPMDAPVHQPSVSNPVTVDVLPRVVASVVPKVTVLPHRPDQKQRQVISDRLFRLSVDVQAPFGLRPRRQPAYVYAARGRGLLTRIAVLRTSRLPRSMWITARGLDWQRGILMVCTRHPLYRVMGPPFSFPACGRGRLRGLAPVGSEFFSHQHLTPGGI